MQIKSKIVAFFVLVFLFFVSGYLRFENLGYSDFIPDEHSTFLHYGRLENPSQTVYEFFMTQRKGPMQAIVGLIPYIFVGDYFNEYSQRLPFAVLNTASIVIFYLALVRLSQNKLFSFISALFLSVNGLIVAFGRLAQYQSLNLFFSFLALYFYSYIFEQVHYRSDSDEKKLLRQSLLGTFFYSLSILSHWDAVYMVVPFGWVLVNFFVSKKFTKPLKTKLIKQNIILGAIILLPFLVPYGYNLYFNSDNVNYFGSRVGQVQNYNLFANLPQHVLYNPFLTSEFYAFSITLGIFLMCLHLYRPIAKNTKNNFHLFAMTFVWLISTYLAFLLFVHHAGTHIYNIVIPICIIVGLVFSSLIHSSPLLIKSFIFISVFYLFGFFYYQSFMIFVDHTKEYPWDSEEFTYHNLSFKTPNYSHKDNLRNLLGFPHNRYWSDVAEFIYSQNQQNNEILGYYTNEHKNLSGFYVRLDHVSEGEFYAVGVKRPTSFANDYKLPHIKNKSTVHKIKDENGETIVNIFRVKNDGR